MSNENLTKEEIERIFVDQIIPQIIRDIKPEEIMEGYILGGQPGSGKSTLVREMLKTNRHTVFINGDDLRPYHPLYYYFLKENDKEAADLTQSVCNFWVEALIKKCIEMKLNMIIEGTMRTKDVPIKTAKILKDAGYLTDLVVVSAPYELSLLSLEYRYSEVKKMGGFARFTKKSSHDEAYKNINETLVSLSGDGLFSKFRVYQRTPDGFKENIFSPGEADKMMEAFNAGRERKLEDQERDPSHYLGVEMKNSLFKTR